jgi:hypothetical protein
MPSRDEKSRQDYLEQKEKGADLSTPYKISFRLILYSLSRIRSISLFKFVVSISTFLK